MMLSSSSSSVVYEGWMVRYDRRKIGRSFVHTRYFVLELRMLSYYKHKPQHKANKVGGKAPIKSLPIDGNCRVEDRGLKMYHGHHPGLATTTTCSSWLGDSSRMGDRWLQTAAPQPCRLHDISADLFFNASSIC
ncbi:hypothetical protein BDA96_01G305100 [Sorghum bicolor]|uniref:PH domain-containing protein n=2 Tax=Sorghum bicolor TaxID=4558 RepID=A0A921S1V1_SORBI|nr:hypothetical protein BDA96_01G305100 [Sorghum bicolor]OQU92049.1 hypothetical protein SORBI_3001G281201 [Sorghum bicolor]